MATTLASELPSLRRALYSIAIAAVLLSAFFCFMFAFVLVGDRGKPQFPYELTISAAGAAYFGALSFLTVRGARGVLELANLAQTLKKVAQAVLGMFVPLAALGVFLIWFMFQPAY